MHSRFAMSSSEPSRAASASRPHGPSRARQGALTASRGLRPARFVVHDRSTLSARYGTLRFAVRSLVATALLPAVLFPLACQQFSDPFKDQLAGRPAPTTASAKGIRGAVPQRTGIRHRGLPAVTIDAKHALVDHGPLYFEDPHETAPDTNGTFAWTLDDYWNILYGPSRFMLDIGFFPVSAVVAPPWIMLKTVPEQCYGIQGAKRPTVEPAQARRSSGTPEAHPALGRTGVRSFIRYERWTDSRRPAAERDVPRPD